MVVTFMMRRINIFLQNAIKEARIKYRKAFAASNYGKCFKGTYNKCKDNSSTQKTILPLEYIYQYKKQLMAHKVRVLGNVKAVK